MSQNTHEREELPEQMDRENVALQVRYTIDYIDGWNDAVAAMKESSAYGRLCRAGREDDFDPSHPWPGVDSVLVSAFACGENDLEFDMIQARRVINEAFLRRLSPQAGGSDGT